MVDDFIVLFSGIAKLPANTSLYEKLVLVVLVDMRSGKIIDVDCSLTSRLSKKFIAYILSGTNIENGLDTIIKKVDMLYQGNERKAIITALRDINGKYLAFIKSQKEAISYIFYGSYLRVS